MANDRLIHVIDDDEAVRASLAFVLDSADHIARTYASARHFLEACDASTGGCVVTDVRMPEMNGLELIREIRARGLALPVIVMTGHGDVPLAVEAMRAGVLEFLEKPFDDEVFLAAVATALDASLRVAQEDGERIRFHALIETLSPRETEVLRGLIAGGSNKIIGRDLGISPRTVEVYRAHIMSKTGASGLSDLVRMAILAKF